MAEQAHALSIRETLDPSTFTFENTSLRVFERDGEPWFVAKDVVEGLGLSHITWALKALDEDELAVETLQSGSQTREMRLISEPGFYKLVGRSRKPAA
ncbi:MAG: BRO-N domain-containing protein, partial [Geminicoccaceae bacterium]